MLSAILVCRLVGLDRPFCDAIGVAPFMVFVSDCWQACYKYNTYHMTHITRRNTYHMTHMTRRNTYHMTHMTRRNTYHMTHITRRNTYHMTHMTRRNTYHMTHMTRRNTYHMTHITRRNTYHMTHMTRRNGRVDTLLYGHCFKLAVAIFHLNFNAHERLTQLDCTLSI